MSKGYLILANGRVFEGERFGAECSADGELVFTTGAGGYIETLTDPNYCGQIIMQTFPLNGNYGWIYGDGGRCFARGYVVREWCEAPSNFRCEGTLDEYLKKEGVPGLCGVDTREITQMIREQGVMPAMISDTPECDMEKLRGFAVTGAIKEVCGGETQHFPAKGEEKYRVTAIDCGSLGGVIAELCTRGCAVTALPHDTAAEAILATKPDGVLISDGPGDPAENAAVIKTVGELFGRLPMLGIGLGHQLLALAAGGKTYKLGCGHRGANQPVRELKTGRIMITSQNHGYAVEADSVAPYGAAAYVNVNDGTCEGLVYPEKNALSVQFRPEASVGPWDRDWIFDDFAAMMGGKR